MKATVTWQNKVAFKGHTETGHDVMMDGSEKFGGENKGARPMELILLGLGGCASFDVVTILEKQRQKIEDVVCELQAERADTVPAVFSKINLHFVVKGTNLKTTQVEKAVALSAEKYCSASKMLQDGGVDITHSIEVVAV